MATASIGTGRARQSGPLTGFVSGKGAPAGQMESGNSTAERPKALRRWCRLRFPTVSKTVSSS
jgi:hypothetical protein